MSFSFCLKASSSSEPPSTTATLCPEHCNRPAYSSWLVCGPRAHLSPLSQHDTRHLRTAKNHQRHPSWKALRAVECKGVRDHSPAVSEQLHTLTTGRWGIPQNVRDPGPSGILRILTGTLHRILQSPTCVHTALLGVIGKIQVGGHLPKFLGVRCQRASG